VRRDKKGRMRMKMVIMKVKTLVKVVNAVRKGERREKKVLHK
jgi:hypothetical protein